MSPAWSVAGPVTSAEGRLIAFEGIDGCGKSTQARLLAARLRTEWDVEVIETREPGGTPVGTRLRELLLASRSAAEAGQPTARTESLLMIADRAQHVETIIGPALERGAWVVTDRFAASTLAYQGYGRFDGSADAMDVLVRANAWAVRGWWPDPSILVRAPVPVAVARMAAAGKSPDRFEGEGAAFLGHVAVGFDRLAEGRPGDWLVVDGTLPADEVADRIWIGLATRWSEP